MEIVFHQQNKDKIAEIISDEILITKVQDALDLMANINYQSSQKIILYERNITTDFFDLKTGIAGEVLQKFVTYNFKLAIIGDFAKYNSNSLNAFIIECNRGNQLFFLSNTDEAIKHLNNL